MNQGKREFRFIPLQEFYYYNDGKMVAKYIPGNTYNCRRDAAHDLLREKCREWESEGKIKIVYLVNGQSFNVIKRG